MAPEPRRPFVGFVDDNTSALILEVQLQDVDQLLQAELKTARQPSEFAQTLMLQKEDIEGALAIIKDRQMSRSIARAVAQDAHMIETSLAQERLAASDRAFACKLAGVTAPPPYNPTPPQTPLGPPAQPAQPPIAKLQGHASFRPESTPPHTPRAPPPHFRGQGTPTPSAPPQAQAVSSQAGTNRPSGAADTEFRRGIPPQAPQAPLETLRGLLTNPSSQPARTPQTATNSKSQSLDPSQTFKNAPDKPVETLNQSNTQRNIPAPAQNSATHADHRSKLGNGPTVSTNVKHTEKAETRHFNTPSVTSQIDLNVSQTGVGRQLVSVSKVAADAEANSTPLELSTTPAKRALEDASNDPETSKRQDTGCAKIGNGDLHGDGNPTSAPAHHLRPGKRALEEHSLSQEPSAKRVDTGKGKDGTLHTGGDTAPSISNAPVGSAPQEIRPAKRSLENPEDQQPATKRIDTGKAKAVSALEKLDSDLGEQKSNGTATESTSTTKTSSSANFTQYRESVNKRIIFPRNVSEPTNCETFEKPSKSTTFTNHRESVNEKIQARKKAPEQTQSGSSEKPSDPPAVSSTSTFGQLTCISCGDIFYAYGAARMPCSHVYCQTCLQTVVTNALTDEAMFPPRCCKQPFMLDDMRRLLSPELISQYGERKVEFETADRTYCSNSACSAFLYPVNITEKEKVGVCPVCFTVTCTMCKGIEHLDECPKDGGILEVLELAEKSGWKRCKKCSRVIELRQGCNNITCKCKAEWCYVCGDPWKTCACPQWDENMLLDQAQRVADRQQPGPARQEQVAAVARQLVILHDCEHEEFTKVYGEYECDECSDEMPWYINRCDQCDIEVCNMCRYNVL
ncbi:ATP-dependent RNA helicase DEAH11-like chloroplastic protein [Lachnellula suecica]|uniref:ATP-dependent RNA helicase DEAH11-like chloroplastic protein n=1 Tax=Lachnellula suecica TaxID=602035 RepID=A0A8T9C317_9HELO|nr:ATP-dependent RNA helicase DEAH11-like chloroplastic protein [Lachnellula suecica]